MPAVEGTGPADGDDVETALRELLAPDTVAARARERRHRERLAAAVTFEGVVAATRSTGATVDLGTRGGHRFRGTVADVGTGVVTLRTAPRRIALVVVDAIVSLHAPGVGPLHDDEPPTAPVELADLLLEAAADRADVVLHLVDGSAISGVLHGCGIDVVSIRSGATDVVYVRLASVDGASLTGSG